MKKVINGPKAALKRTKLIIHRETIALLTSVQLNGVASGQRLTVPALAMSESVDIVCDTTVSTQTRTQ